MPETCILLAPSKFRRLVLFGAVRQEYDNVLDISKMYAGGWLIPKHAAKRGHNHPAQMYPPLPLHRILCVTQLSSGSSDQNPCNK
jgi:hypothetical protein